MIENREKGYRRGSSFRLYLEDQEELVIFDYQLIILISQPIAYCRCVSYVGVGERPCAHK